MVRELRELVLSFFLTAVCEVRGDEPQGRAMDCDFANGGASLFARVKGAQYDAFKWVEWQAAGENAIAPKGSWCV